MRRISIGDLRAPAKVIDLDSMSLQASSGTEISVKEFRTIWCLHRLHGVPTSISFWDVDNDATVILKDLQSANSATQESTDPDSQRTRRATSTIEITVAICTRNRPEQLRRALLSLNEQTDVDFEILVVDNAPRSRSTAEAVDLMNLDRCEYVVEPKGGLSRARNTALLHVHTDHVAWIDDGEVADPNWVRSLKEGFAHVSKPVAVCGLMLPAELDTEAQIRFEQFGGFNKGRDLFAEILSADSPFVANPLYPLPAVGSGGNMAFQLSALTSAGGFDPFLGAGTRTHGGEETKMFASLLRSGETILHWPKAITWHFHRREMIELHQQFQAYSAGLSAFYMSMIRSDPSVLLELHRIFPLVLRDLGLRGGGIRTDQLPADFPKSLLRASRRGLLAGGISYVHEALSAN